MSDEAVKLPQSPASLELAGGGGVWLREVPEAPAPPKPRRDRPSPLLLAQAP
jgi:hypothetical protein